MGNKVPCGACGAAAPSEPSKKGSSGSEPKGQQQIQPTISEKGNRNGSVDPYVGVYVSLGGTCEAWDDVLPDLCSSGCTEVIWMTFQIGADDKGNLTAIYATDPYWDLVKRNEDGSMTYTGDEKYPFSVACANLKNGRYPTSITRVSLTLLSEHGAAGSFEAMARIKQQEGQHFCSIPESQLWKAFKCLFDAVPALDSIDLDDETMHDSTILAEFSNMIMYGLNKQTIPCPFKTPDYWKQMVDKTIVAKDTIPMLHLQNYDGGQYTNQNISDWKFEVPSYSSGDSTPFVIPVNPGFTFTGVPGKCATPADMKDKMVAWRNSANEAGVPVNGAWIWIYTHGMSVPLEKWVSAIKYGMSI